MRIAGKLELDDATIKLRRGQTNLQATIQANNIGTFSDRVFTLPDHSYGTDLLIGTKTGGDTTKRFLIDTSSMNTGTAITLVPGVVTSVTLTLPAASGVLLTNNSINTPKLPDTGADHKLSLLVGEDFTNDQTLTFITGDASRQLSMGGNITTVGALSTGGALTTADVFNTTGAFALTLTTTAATTVTLPEGTNYLPAAVATTTTADRAMISDGAGLLTASTVTATELSYSSGVTSAIQTQLNGKEPTVTKGDLTSNDTQVATITTGTGAVIGSGTTINILTNVANGLLKLNGSAKIDPAYLSVSAMEFKGSWDANTNTPTLVDATGTSGDTYRVSVAGSQDLGSGSVAYSAGDWIYYDGAIWQRSDNVDEVLSVNSQTGAVVLTTTDIAEGTNLYYTDARARTAVITQVITDAVTDRAPSEDAVFDALAGKENTIAAATANDYYRGDKTFQNLATAVAATASVAANTAKVSADGSITSHSDVGGAAPTDGQVLTWINANNRYEPAPAAGGGYTDPLTTNGDIVIRAAGTTTRLPVGTDGQILKLVGGLPAWGTDNTGGGGGLSYNEVATSTGVVGGNMYMVDSTASRTLTLPASPAQGDQLLIIDGTDNASAAPIVIARNGKLINGLAADYQLDTDGGSVELWYTTTLTGGATWRTKS